MGIPHPIYKDSWDTFGVRFEDGKDEVIFLSLTIDRGSQQLVQSDIVATVKLQAEKIAKAVLVVDGQPCGVECYFWWEPSTSLYPHLWTKVQRGEATLVASGLDFIRTVSE